MKPYLIKYLIDNSDLPLSAKYIDYLKLELDWHIWAHGDNLSDHVKLGKHYKNFKSTVAGVLQFVNSRAQSNKDNNILSNIYMPIQQPLIDLGFNPLSPIWNPIGITNIIGDAKIRSFFKDIDNKIQQQKFTDLISSELHSNLEEFQDYLIQFYSNCKIKAYLAPTDQLYKNKIHFEIFKKMGRPSFVFSHGMPGIYCKEVDNRSDYLLVWSEKIRQNYINVGFDPSKIYAIGHPLYKNIEKKKELRSSFEDILVIPISSCLYHQHTYDSVMQMDPSMVVLYLYQTQNVLQKLGIKKARFRPHPSINMEWVWKFIDHKFYIKDTDPLQESLSKSTLVIGSVSTVILESLINGVNYINFDPLDSEQNNLIGTKQAPPFDGSDPKLVRASTEDELLYILKNNIKIDYTFVNDYIQNLDLSILKQLI